MFFALTMQTALRAVLKLKTGKHVIKSLVCLHASSTLYFIAVSKAKLFCTWTFLSAAFFGIRAWVALKGPWILGLKIYIFSTLEFTTLYFNIYKSILYTRSVNVKYYSLIFPYLLPFVYIDIQENPKKTPTFGRETTIYSHMRSNIQYSRIRTLDLNGGRQLLWQLKHQRSLNAKLHARV